MSTDRFCPHCGVALDLHGTDEPDPTDCELAERKADLVSMFWKVGDQ